MTKNSTILLNVALLSSLGLTVSCNKPLQKKPAPSVSTSIAAKLAQKGQTSEASEMYSRIGEILLSKPQGITHAEEMFQKALEINPNDNKANLYSATFAPILTAKGFGPRFKILIPEIGKLEKEFVDTDIKEIMDFALVMPEGKVAAKKYEDLRKFYRDEFAKELGSSVSKLENIKSERFSVELDVSSYAERSKSPTYCREIEVGTFECDSQQYSLKDKLVRRFLDQYDIRAIKGIMKTQKNALTIAYSFGLQGAEEVSALLSNTKGPKTDEEVIAAIRTQPNFLRIEGSKDDLRQIFDHSEEVLNELIDFSKLSKELCHNEARESNVASNICVSEAAAEKINDILMFVVGPKEVVIGHDENGDDVTVEVNLRGLLDSKVSSLQELLPNRFDRNGRAIDFKDLTFAGLIPNADLIAKLKTVVK